MELLAPAKINLFLEVLDRRQDGYHNIETIFQTVSLFDEIKVNPSRKNIYFNCSNSSIKKEQNIAYRAAAILKKETKINLGAEIFLKKNIPLGAGLGGGSSDAAAVLKSLIGLWKLKISEKRLMEMAKSLGADVPFFLKGGTAAATGVGEKIKSIKNVTPVWYILIYPGFPVNTGSVYAKLKFPLTNKQKINKIRELLASGYKPNRWGRHIYNRLEETVIAEYPEISKIKDILKRLGYQGVMSGSGSTVFTIVNSFIEGENLKKQLEKFPWEVFLVKSV